MKEQKLNGEVYQNGQHNKMVGMYSVSAGLRQVSSALESAQITHSTWNGVCAVAPEAMAIHTVHSVGINGTCITLYRVKMSQCIHAHTHTHTAKSFVFNNECVPL